MKRIVICCDHAWNDACIQFTETNVALMARAIQIADGARQVVLYIRGAAAPARRQHAIGPGTGPGIDDDIRSAYAFLSQTFLPGDEIFLFGFSRGAYVARCIPGMIAACGILKRQRLDDLDKAWTYYRGLGPRSPRDFMESCGVDCHLEAEIKFLGVWDTVGAPRPPGEPRSCLERQDCRPLDDGPSVVRHGCHALAIEEHRSAFTPSLWTGEAPAGAHIEQVWFAGAHSDVGGGYITRDLADIPLVWMAKKAERDGLALDWSRLPDPDNLDPTAPSHDSRAFYFEAAKIRPTWRVVLGARGGARISASHFDQLYTPVDARGHPAAVINEMIHESAVMRWGSIGLLCTNDARGATAQDLWMPKNLAPFFDGDGNLKPEIPVSP